ncbi:transposase [Legionella santicrucis]|uniref:transposase n=1 Tax=Legionella santicrucis TaxID=45074 RepID=UPI0010559CC7|nr:transposase [Legionella santicrucis]
MKRERAQSISLLPVYPPSAQISLIAEEINPPEEQEPLEWVLLTNVKINDATGAHNILKWYLCRWQIEVYFRILKSGCRIEKLQITESQRFDPCLALYMIIA